MPRQRRDDRRRKERRYGSQFAGDFGVERRFDRRAEPGAVHRTQLADPLVALREHAGDERDRAARVVVEMREQPQPRCIVGRRCRERIRCSSRVQRRRVLGITRRSAHSRRKRRLTRQSGRERVDREHGQTRRMRDELPAVAPIGIERGARKIARAHGVR